MCNKLNLRLVAKLTSVLALSLSPHLLSASTYTQTNLVSNIPGLASYTDPNLQDPWGVAYSPTSPFWISNQASNTSTLYQGDGSKVPLTVTIPGSGPNSGPTGQVFNGGSGFSLGQTGPARFIFANLNGSLDAWNGSSGMTAMVVANTPGAVYTGLALASVQTSDYLYAADSTGHIRVFDSAFHPVTPAGNFTDPKAISGYTPFNIQAINNSLYVSYTNTAGNGGYVDVFNTDGTFAKRLITGGPLNGPWGMAIAPSTFGAFANDLLIGNNGNGEINAFDPTTGAFAGTLDGTNNEPIANSNLWFIGFRTGGANVDTNSLYFTAGIGESQTDGLFGAITPTPEPTTIALAGLGILALALSFKRA